MKMDNVRMAHGSVFSKANANAFVGRRRNLWMMFLVLSVVAVWSHIALATGSDPSGYGLLDGYFFTGREDPVKGKYYMFITPLTVRQVLNSREIFVTTDPKYPLSEPTDRVVFVQLDADTTMSDGSEFHPIGSSLYKCTGTYSYNAVTGARMTVFAFSQCSIKESEALNRKWSAIRKELEEREKQRQIELHKQALKEQPIREVFASNLMSKIDFNYRKRFYVTRDDYDEASPIDISIDHIEPFVWIDRNVGYPVAALIDVILCIAW